MIKNKFANGEQKNMSLMNKEIKEKWKQEIRKGNVSPCRCGGKSLLFAEAYKEVLEEDLGIIKKDEHKE